MTHIANHRYVVIGKHADQYAPICATDDFRDAIYLLKVGHIDDRGQHWVGIHLHDRRHSPVPRRCWHADPFR